MQPRQVAYMASSTNLSYTYSHQKMQPEEWNVHVAEIKVYFTYEYVCDVLNRLLTVMLACTRPNCKTLLE